MTEVLAPDIYIELAGFNSQTKSKRLQRACEQFYLKHQKAHTELQTERDLAAPREFSIFNDI